MSPKMPLLLALLLPVMGPAWSDVYTVRTADGAGPDSLRWAMDMANMRGGPDTIVFDPSLSGETIYPESPLPVITDSRTTIDGDIDDDGAPDIELRGSLLTVGAHGLQIEGNHTTIVGLAVLKFTWCGIRITGVSDCRIRACHIGVALDGTHGPGNNKNDIYLVSAEDTIIGGRGPNGRNIICGGAAARNTFGIALLDSRRTTIIGNYIGVTRDGTGIFGRGGVGIGMLGIPPRRLCTDNVIGGTSASERNVLGGLKQGISMGYTSDNVISGNYLGLSPSGNSVRRIGQWAIGLVAGAVDNRIGGTTPGERNVIAGTNIGVCVLGVGEDPSRNTIQGNYFGVNAAGTTQKRFGMGVYVAEGGTDLTIGGDSPAAGNYFTSKKCARKAGVFCLHSGEGLVIRHNKFGVRPDGRDALFSDHGIHVLGEGAEITDNKIVRCAFGVALGGGSEDRFRVFRNIIRRCAYGVYLAGNGRYNLGILDNTPTSDDGGNRFRASNLWHIYNTATTLVKAEGNDFGTTVRSELNAKTYDKKDNSSCGRVDFTPLMGGVVPTGDAGPVLAITGATAVSTANGGAEVTFSLSAPASVTATVLNIAGRPVRELCHTRACAAGRNTLTWNGRSDGGLAVAGGMYLVQVTARDDGGRQSSALTQLSVRR